jgi:hypothetical protein
MVLFGLEEEHWFFTSLAIGSIPIGMTAPTVTMASLQRLLLRLGMLLPQHWVDITILAMTYYPYLYLKEAWKTVIIFPRVIYLVKVIGEKRVSEKHDFNRKSLFK